MSLVEKLTDDKSRALLQQAKKIDRIDRVLGPIAGTMQVFGDPVLSACSVAIELFELAVYKVPFVAKYLRHTKDYDALVWWVPKEIFSNLVPYGDFVDIHATYSLRAGKFFEERVIAQQEQILHKLERKVSGNYLS